MKTIISLLTALLLFANLQGYSKDKPSKKTITIHFHVPSICSMCEMTIEKAVDVKGVVAADYNLDSEILEITYKPAKISEDQLHHLINEVGYDTEKFRATDEQYSRVNECCRYRDMDKH